MAPLGADVDALHELAGSMRAASRRLEDIAIGLDRRRRSTGWTGPDADRFAGDWDARHRPALIALGRRCTQQAARLDAQVAEQRHASSAPGGAIRSAAGVASVTAPPSTRIVAPRTERRYVGGIDIKATFLSATIEGDVSILDVGGGRSRVSVTDAGLVGVVGSFGASASFGIGDENAMSTPTNGAQVEARARVGGVQRRSWVVDDDAVGGLLARIAAAEALERTSPMSAVPVDGGGTTVIGGGSSWMLRAAGSAVDAVAGIVGFGPDLDDRIEALLTIPGPERSEHLLEVKAVVRGGIAGLGDLAPAAHGSFDGALRAGFGVEGGRRSTIVEMEGSLVGAFSTAVLGKVGVTNDSKVLAHSMRLELIERRSRDGIERFVFTTSERSGSDLTETTFDVQLDDRGSDHLARSLRSAAGQLARGDLSGAAATLQRATAVTDLADRMTVSTATSDLSGKSARAGGNVGAGLTVGLNVRGQALEVRHGAAPSNGR